MVTQLAFKKFRLAKLQVPPSRPKFAEGLPFEFELGRRMAQELGSSPNPNEMNYDIVSRFFYNVF